MGAAASVRAGEEIANSIARIHPMFPEYIDPKVKKMYNDYSKTEGLAKIFSNEAGQESFMRFLQSECNYKHKMALSVSNPIDHETLSSRDESH